MTVWQGNTKRWQFIEVPYTAISATDTGTEYLVGKIDRDATIFNFLNNTDKVVNVLLAPPEKADKKELFFSLISNYGFGSETLNSGGIFTIPAGSYVYVHARGQNLASGAFRFFVWG